AGIGDLFDHVPLVVDLDRVNTAVASLVAEYLDGAFEGVGNLADAVAEDVGEAVEDGQVDCARVQLRDQLFQVDGLHRLLGGVSPNMAGLVDSEIALAPVTDAVQFGGVLDLPLID